MRDRTRDGAAPLRLSGRERGAIAEFLAYFEERVRGVEPACADLLHMARLALHGPGQPADRPQTTH